LWRLARYACSAKSNVSYVTRRSLGLQNLMMSYLARLAQTFAILIPCANPDFEKVCAILSPNGVPRTGHDHIFKLLDGTERPT
jgi:hypothetical protein